MRFFAFVLSFIFAAQAMAFNPGDLRAFGKTAPVQLYLFTSLTCPHCADFHKNVLPVLKKEYAEKGKAQIIVVDMVSSENGLTATQILRCLDIGAADRLEDDLYSYQSKWMSQSAGDARKTIASYAAKQEMTQDAFNLCLSDTELRQTIIEQQANLARLYGVSATPTLIMREGTEVRKWSGSEKKAILKGLKEAFQK